MTRTIYSVSDNLPPPDGQKRFLIVADDTEEFGNALRYAAKSAAGNRVGLAVLTVVRDTGFWHWGGIEQKIWEEQKQEAERRLNEHADRIRAISGIETMLFLDQGNAPHESIMRLIKNGPGISKLILGADTRGRNPGPLVSFFSGKGLNTLPVTLTLIPDHLSPEAVDALL